MDIENIEDVTRFCVDNLYLMDTNSQKYIPDLYTAFLNLLEFKSDRKNIAIFKSEQSEAFDNVFHALVKSLLKEYKDICNKLELPEPAL